jgi:flagellar protein FlgJ
LSAQPDSQEFQNLLRGHDARTAPTSPSHLEPLVDRSKVDPQLVEAAEGMESMFLDYMLKVMRQTIPKNEMDLESPATDIYRGMMDGELAKKVAHQGGIGLADQLIAYLDSKGYHLPNTNQLSDGHKVKEKP